MPEPDPVPRVAGLLLAAGAGSRMGTPKALVHDEAGSWLRRAVATLREGGCAPVVVVLGARADEATDLLRGEPVTTVVAHDWADGMSASLRTGLAAVPDDAAAVVLTLVDLPDMTPDVVRRVVATAAPDALARAVYHGTPGHPVLLGREHLAGVAASARGDAGARHYLARHDVVPVECGDLATGRDVDRPPSAASGPQG